MTTISSSSSSLHILERHNHSKSTVSSSDTDGDSAGYVSSSGTTTPEDDTQTFHLGPTFPSNPTDKSDKSKCALRGKPTIVTKYHTLSVAMKRVKKVAHALVVFKKKRPDDISPILISSPLRERFGKRMSVKPQPDEGFYSLPNRRFSLSDVSVPLQSQRISRRFGTVSGSTSDFARGSFRKQRSGPRIPSFSTSQNSASPLSTPLALVPYTKLELGDLTFRTVLTYVLRVLFFAPWCVAVGGALLLFPTYVELVAFRSGYLSSPKGIRRFAHWADCGQQHVMIFLAFLLAVIWYSHALGLSLACLVVSRFVFVWRGFEIDKRIPLGEDDQQSLYLVVTGLMSADGWTNVSGKGDEIEGDH